ncbi:hypothetical protein GYMLUDRAFT_246069 [Collybiopsis luxurians FD-317 M1]|uniref:Uncharacterized protein n=1 Tax=Collybiopsis luxurians FD-317 M1 TaxID=944289 RepID=A0A0D0B4T4_9AGAR|nr:hypothetical protein GYMLUDRAFT_246069 [Collybiopsis luxurians FD-317 M1]
MAKPTIYKNDSDKIGFAVSYLTGAAATHYNNLLKQEEAGIPVPALYTWIDFVKLAWIKQMDNKLFATFIIRFQEYAFKMGYNNTALVAMLRGAVTRSLNITVAAQTHPPQNYPQWVQQFQELDNLICATNAAHSCGGNSGFGMYKSMAPLNPQNSNPQQGRNQDNISGTVYGQSEDFASASSQNGNSGEGLENQGGNDGVLKNPGDKEFLQVIQAARTPQQVEEFH